MRSLFITKNIPYPPVGGVALRNWQNMNILMNWGEVGVFSFSNWNPERKAIAGLSLWRHCNVVEARTGKESWARRFWWLRRFGHPEADWAYAQQGARELAAILSEFKPDVVIFEEVWLFRYLQTVRDFGCAIIFDEHNVEADIYQQKYSQANNLRSQLKFRRQYPQLLAMERAFLQIARQTWVCSQPDQKLLQARYNQPSFVVPNAVNVNSYELARNQQEPIPKGLNSEQSYLLFMGQLSYLPNTIAVEWLLSEIYPQLRSQLGDFTLLLVGRCPTAFMEAAAAADRNILVTGSVPDVRPYLAIARAMIVPLRQGGGTRLKILEAMASGCPVISTSKGSEGLEATHNQELLIADTTGDLIAEAVRMWQDPDLRSHLRQRALQLVQAQYSWEAAQRAIEKALVTDNIAPPLKSAV
ncbi:MAG: glycosyltransferase [Cyanobacteria bacterium P01_H01_bin.15]